MSLVKMIIIAFFFIYLFHLEGIQIQHISGNHWITSCSIGREIAAYDSSFNGDLSSSLTQLALIYRSLVINKDDGEVAPHLMVNVPPVQQQSGVNDCGIFAIAFALHKLLGDNLEDIDLTSVK